MGIRMDNCSIDVAVMQEQKTKCVKGLTLGIEMLFKMNKVDYKKGTATFSSPNSLKVAQLDGSEITVDAKNFIIATGSVPSPMPGGAVVADEQTVLTSTGALSLHEPPKTMVVIGGT